jgi:ubiquinone/menaquinone biosynthesis C-methylase UbiE
MEHSVEGYRSRLQDQTAAEKYATRFERGPRRRINEREQRAVRSIFAQLTDCQTVLDVPCGAGRFQDALVAGRRQIIEMDVAVEVLTLARQRAQRSTVQGEFVVGDASRLPLRDGCVDAIFCNRLLHHIAVASERLLFLREFRRITRRYLVVSFFDYLAFGSLRRFLKALKGRKVNYSGQPTLSQFQKECEQSGFNILRIVPTGPIWVAEKYLVLQAAK